MMEKTNKNGVKPDVYSVLLKISSQLERLIICQEKRLSGEVFKNFNSKKHLKGE